jgi:copper(I)-binding protein
MRRMKSFILLVATAALSVPAVAQAPSLHVSGWARAGSSSSAAYVTVHNAGRAADRLIGASSPVAARVSVHDSRNVGGVLRMRAAGAFPIAPGASIAMKPGGLHVMLSGLKAPLRPGTKLPLVLRFEKAGLVRASLPVQAAGAQGPAPEVHHGH